MNLFRADINQPLWSSEQQKLLDDCWKVYVFSGLAGAATGFGVSLGGLKLVQSRIKSKIPNIMRYATTASSSCFFGAVCAEQSVLKFHRKYTYGDAANAKYELHRKSSVPLSMVDFLYDNRLGVVILAWLGSVGGYLTYTCKKHENVLPTSLKLIHTRVFAQVVGLATIGALVAILPTSAEKERQRAEADAKELTKFDNLVGDFNAKENDYKYGPRFT